MTKLLGGLGFCLVLSALQPAGAQDPFSPTYEPAPTVSHGPNFQSIPLAQRERPARSRAQNAHVRGNRTAAQTFIQKRAAYEAQQRARRIAHRKWKGESLLRPSNPPDHSWFQGYSVPVWYWANLD